MKPARAEWINKNYTGALKELERNSYLSKRYNKDLYQLEKARLLQLNGNDAEAVKLLNQVDDNLDSWDKLKVRSSNGSVFIAKSVYGSNPKIDSFETPNQFQLIQYNKIFYKKPYKLEYRAEHYERLMIYYLKAQCYMRMQKVDEAVVEARRIVLLAHQLDDLKQVELNYTIYVQDPFPYFVAGFIYEWAGEKQEAMISYENAYACYNQYGVSSVYGVDQKEVLRQSLLNLALQLNDEDKIAAYQLTPTLPNKNTPANELLLLIESGDIPYKDRKAKYYLYDTLRKSFAETNVNMGWTFYYPTVNGTQNQYSFQIQIDSMLYTPELLRNHDHILYQCIQSRADYESNIRQTEVRNYVNEKNPYGKKYEGLDNRSSETLMSKIWIVRVPLHLGMNTLILKSTQGEVYDTLRVNSKKQLEVRTVFH